MEPAGPEISRSSSSSRRPQRRHRLPHSDSESSISYHSLLSSSVSGDSLLGSHHHRDSSLATGKWHSDSNLRLPPIVPTKIPVLIHGDRKVGTGPVGQQQVESRRSSRLSSRRSSCSSSSIGSHSRTSSVDSTHSYDNDPTPSSHTDVDTFSDGKLQPLYEMVPSETSIQTYNDHTHIIAPEEADLPEAINSAHAHFIAPQAAHSGHSHTESNSGHTHTKSNSGHTHTGSDSDHTPIEIGSGHTPPPFLDTSHELELFHYPMSARVEEESLAGDMTPTEETIEGAGLYDPRINRLPDCTGAEFRVAEDSELQKFTDTIQHTVQEATAMLIGDTLERTKAQYSKVINRYREQFTMLQREHEAEKRHLEEQISMEKRKTQEGVHLQRHMRSQIEQELKSQVGMLESMFLQYDGKKQQVLELRQRLRQSEEELRTVRTDMVEQKKKVSGLMPLPSRPNGTGQAKMLTKMEETQAYLDSMSPHLPDENMVKNQLAKRLRQLKKRPFTTGMLHKEPNPEQKEK